jgi:hypothetical protein
MTRESDRDGPDRVRATDGGPGDADVLRARIATDDERPDELTIVPPDVEPAAQATKWISAREGSFVELDAVR